MKKLYLGLVMALVLTGCSRSVPVPAETTLFNPDIQVQSSEEFHLYSNVTSSEPWIDATDHALATFTQLQVWNTPGTTNVKIDYPYLQENTSAALAFNTLMRGLIADEVSSFLGQLPDSVSEDWGDIANELLITGDVLAMTPTFISANIAVAPYFAGAAHPGLYYRTINFDLDSGVNLGTTELLTNSSLGLPIVQEKVIPRLVEFLNEGLSEDLPPITPDEEWVQTGTEPVVENYQNIALTREGLYVQFDPYQVAAYALGAPYVTIPYSELVSVVNPGILKRSGLN